MFDAFRYRGAEVVFFSPMAGEVPDVDGIYLGGGYPELYAEILENSETTVSLKVLHLMACQSMRNVEACFTSARPMM